MIIGIDLGGTKILTAVATKEGKILSSARLDTQARFGPKKVTANILRSVDLALKKAKVPMSKISCIGVGAPGPIIDNGVIIAPPNLPGWNKVNIKTYLQKLLKKPVIVENDANAAALAEFMFGAGLPAGRHGKGAKSLVYITISTGIGGGIILNGKIYGGSIGTAGEIGHMVIDMKGPKCGCGNYGCLEAMAAGPAIARMAGKKDALDAFIAAKKGNKRAKEAINNAGKALGIGIANLNNLINPEIVVLGGGVTNMGNMLLGPVRKWAKMYSMKANRKSLKIVTAKLKSNVGVLGAIALCMEGLPRQRRGDD
jgi:glucokinase